MKICFLAKADNYHTKKWCEYFVNKGYEVDVISFTNDIIEGVNVHYINSNVDENDSDLKKIKYLLYYKKVKKIIDDIKPDVINAHYATSYGMIASLAVPKKFLLSVWGTDVYEFPKKSIIHKLYFKHILSEAKCIFSTSESMKNELQKYTNKKIYITFFGVRMDLFNPDKKQNKNVNEFVVGITKRIEEKYGLDYLIESISIINKIRPDINIKLKIVGKGSKEEEYKKLAIEQKVNVDWLGFLPQEKVAYELANMDIAIFPSICQESFGVSAIEAQACGIPVIVSNAPGFLETTLSGKTSIIVEKRDAESIANSIIKLYDNNVNRLEMGKAGREFVYNKFEYNKCFEIIEKYFYDFKN